MKRQAMVPMEVVEYSGFHYSTLDFVSPSGTCPGVQLDDYVQVAFKTLPPAWELVPYSEDVVEHVVKQYSWGTGVLIFAGGQGCITVAAATEYDREMLGVRAPHWTGTWLRSEGGTKFKPSQGRGRILIRTPAVSAGAVGAGLWERRRHTDFVVSCGGDDVPCHGAVLAEASPVFEGALASEMQEAAHRRLEVQDTSPQAVQWMVAFIYTRQLPEPVPPDGEIASLLRLADRFQVRALIAACARLLLRSLTKENVVDVTRALRGFREEADVAPLWQQLQKAVKADEDLLGAMMDFA